MSAHNFKPKPEELESPQAFEDNMTILVVYSSDSKAADPSKFTSLARLFYEILRLRL